MLSPCVDQLTCLCKWGYQAQELQALQVEGVEGSLGTSWSSEVKEKLEEVVVEGSLVEMLLGKHEEAAWVADSTWHEERVRS